MKINGKVEARTISFSVVAVLLCTSEGSLPPDCSKIDVREKICLTCMLLELNTPPPNENKCDVSLVNFLDLRTGGEDLK